jgi:hypothetical protein
MIIFYKKYSNYNINERTDNTGQKLDSQSADPIQEINIFTSKNEHIKIYKSPQRQRKGNNYLSLR